MKAPLSVRAWGLVCDSLRLAFAGLDAICSAVFLGLLGEKSLAAMGEAFYAGQGRWQEDAYNLEGLKEWEKAFVDRYLGGSRRVLVAGAGGGREVLALARAGFDVSGFDCNARLVESARAFLARQGVSAPVMLSAPDCCPRIEGLFDAVVVGWGAYTHIQGRGRRVAFLRELRAHLQVGGPLLLSFWDRPLRSRRLSWIYWLGGTIRVITGRPRLEPGDDLLRFYAHWFTREEIAAELAQAGFRLDYFSLSPYGHAVGIAVDGADKGAAVSEGT